MNWYKTAYNKMDSLATEYSRKVFDVFKEHYKNRKDDYSGYFKTIDVDPSTGFRQIYIQIFPMLESKYLVSVQGSLLINKKDSSLKRIRTEISYNSKKFSEKDFSKLIFKIKDSLRHEFEHLSQTDEYLDKEYVQSNPYGKLDEFLGYLSSGPELEARVAGMYYQAKKMKVSFLQILADYIEDIKRGFSSRCWANDIQDNISGYYNKIDQIKNKMYNYAVKRYPNINKVEQYELV